jgi:hypothetical protein
MTTHPSIHLDLVRERQRALIAQTERQLLVRAEQRAATPPAVPRLRRLGRSGLLWRRRRRAGERPIPKAPFRELAHRIDGGVQVMLLWSADENRLAVAVFDAPAGQVLVLDAERDEALDVFYHPYVHANSQQAA